MKISVQRNYNNTDSCARLAWNVWLTVHIARSNQIRENASLNADRKRSLGLNFLDLLRSLTLPLRSFVVTCTVLTVAINWFFFFEMQESTKWLWRYTVVFLILIDRFTLVMTGSKEWKSICTAPESQGIFTAISTCPPFLATKVS